MLALCLLLASNLTDFPAAPVPDQLALGKQLAVKMPRMKPEDILKGSTKRNELESVLGKDRITIGKWSNGYTQQDTEWIVWLSPGLMSRWLGFLDGREYWPSNELEKRWNLVRARLDGKLCFVVFLAAYPKLATLITSDEEPAKPDDIDAVRFVLTSGGQHSDMQSLLLARKRSSERFDFRNFKWWLELDLGNILAPEFDHEPSHRAMYETGDFHGAWYVVWIDQPQLADSGFQVRALSKNKERVATFGKPSKSDISKASKKPRGRQSNESSSPPSSIAAHSGSEAHK